MLSYKITVASGLVLRFVCNKCFRGGWGCVCVCGGGGGGAHHKNQFNLLPSMLVKRYNAWSSGLLGRVLVWRLNVCWFEYIHWQSHYVVSLSEVLSPLLSLIQPMKTRPDMTVKLLTGMYRIKRNTNDVQLYSKD